MQDTSTHYNIHCNTLQHTATYYNTLQHTLKHTLQHTLQHAHGTATAFHFVASDATILCNSLCNTLCNILGTLSALHVASAEGRDKVVEHLLASKASAECPVLQRVQVQSVFPGVAVCQWVFCSMVKYVMVRCSMLQYPALCCSTLQHVVVCCSVFHPSIVATDPTMYHMCGALCCCAVHCGTMWCSDIIATIDRQVWCRLL